MSTHPKRKEILEWLRRCTALEEATPEQRWATYQTWSRCADAWNDQLCTGSTYTLRAIAWYQHVFKPGSTDSRPGIILPEIVKAMEVSA